MNFDEPVCRILVVGISAAGKSTMARQLAAGTGLPHVELDTLRFDETWEPRSDEWFHDRLVQLAEEPEWVADGNFMRFTKGTLWPAADLVIWADPPVRTCIRRAIGRTLRRKMKRESSPNGAPEKLVHLLDVDHPVRLLLKGTGPRRDRIRATLDQRAESGGATAHVTNPAELERLIDDLVRAQGVTENPA